MKKSILLATNNPHKVEKLSWIVGGYFSVIETPKAAGVSIKVEENGKTFETNAINKAVEYSKRYHGYVIATDGGVSIPALGEEWDSLRTKRFAGEGISDTDRIRALLDIMKEKKGEEREMNWREAIAVAKSGKLLFSTEVEGVKGVLQETFDPAKYKQGSHASTNFLAK